MIEMDKNDKQFVKDNWKEIIGIIYNQIGEKILFEELLIQYEPCKEFLEVLESIILVNKNWFTSNISFKTKKQLIEELIGNSYCEQCGDSPSRFEVVNNILIEVCESCNYSKNKFIVQNPKF